MPQVTRLAADRLIKKEINDVIAWNHGQFQTNREREAMIAGAETVAIRVLAAIGCFDEDDRRRDARDNRLAAEAERNHRAFCKSTGLPY